MEINFSVALQQRNRADVAFQMFPQGVENLPSCVNASLGWGPPGGGGGGRATSGLIESSAFVVPSWTGWVQDLEELDHVPVLRSQHANTIRGREPSSQKAVGRVMKMDGRDEATLREVGWGGGQAGPAQRQPLVKPL